MSRRKCNKKCPAFIVGEGLPGCSIHDNEAIRPGDDCCMPSRKDLDKMWGYLVALISDIHAVKRFRILKKKGA
jgi:hypothetical protein